MAREDRENTQLISNAYPETSREHQENVQKTSREHPEQINDISWKYQEHPTYQKNTHGIPTTPINHQEII